MSLLETLVGGEGSDLADVGPGVSVSRYARVLGHSNELTAGEGKLVLHS